MIKFIIFTKKNISVYAPGDLIFYIFNNINPFENL